MLVSVMLHVILALLFVGLQMAEAFTLTSREVEEKPPEPETFLEIRPEMFEQVPAPEPPVEEPPAPAEPSERFMATNEGQETAERPEDTRYFGERNTLAASSADAVEDALPVPSQDGREPRREDEMELMDTDFADGETEGTPGAPGDFGRGETESSAEGEAVAEEMVAEPEPVEESLPEPDTEQETAEDRLERAREEARQLLSLDESVPARMREDIPEPKEEPAPEEQIPEPKEEKKPSASAGGRPGERGTENGYQREARKNRMHGSIRRSGKSAVDVEDSVMGRYLAEVNKQIEKAWQRECIMRREHIMPGVLTVRFTIEADGGVGGFRFESRIAGGAIQEGFTMRAVQKADIPEMNAELKGELEGEPMEMYLTFYF